MNEALGIPPNNQYASLTPGLDARDEFTQSCACGASWPGYGETTSPSMLLPRRWNDVRLQNSARGFSKPMPRRIICTYVLKGARRRFAPARVHGVLLRGWRESLRSPARSCL
jgi:hypothetical protein